MRKFAIYTEPHISDPAWAAPVHELLDNGEVEIHADSGELLDAALDLHWKLGKASGVAQENIRTMQFFESRGWSREQIQEWRHFNGNKQ